MEDSGKWRMKKVDKMEEENKEILDGRWWRKKKEGRWRRGGMKRQQEMDKDDRRDRETEGIEKDKDWRAMEEDG